MTVTGQHRYILTLHAAVRLTLTGGSLFSTSSTPATDPVTDHFEVVVNGYVLADPGCATGAAGAAIGTCVLGAVGDTYRGDARPARRPATG